MNKSKIILNFVLILIISGVLQSCSTTDRDLIPREVLFGNPEKTRPRISPDGKMLAYVAPVEGVLNVWLKTIGRDDDHPVTRDDDRGIMWHFWAKDNKHIMYLQDRDGNENWRLYSVNLETGQIGDLTPYDDVQVRVVARNRNFPDELLIAMNIENKRLHDVYRLDLNTGDVKKVAENPGTVVEWLTDSEFRVRGAMFATSQGGFDFKVREDEQSPWRTLISWDAEDAIPSRPLKFTKDGRHVYIEDSRNSNTSRLLKVNIKTGEYEVIAEDENYDIGRVIIHPDTYEVQMVSFIGEREDWVVIDQSIREDVEIIRNLNPGDFYIYDRDDADRTWLVGFTVDDGPISYYAYDRQTKEGTFLFYHRPELNDYKLARMEPIEFTSRDGLTIHGYITFPPDKERKNLPMVLNVHGGPYYRNFWGFDPEAQWFADRGYICLQVNFRGSTGYGKDFINAADREWGGKMHEDLVDAVKWAVRQGYADPDRVAIYGASFGGYAALVGATFTPDLFCCAVDVVGPSNLITMLKTIPPYWTTMKEVYYKRIGHPEKDAEFLKSRSPYYRAGNIKIPILIAQGANDPRVKQAESEQIVKVMKEKGIEYKYMLFQDEGHGFVKPENRLKFYAAAEEFLAEHLGGKFEKAPPQG